MPRRRWLIKVRRTPLSPARRAYLELGFGGIRVAHERTPLDGYLEAVWFTGDRDRADAWRTHGEAITAAWVLEHAGTRPWAWWAYTAPEPRQCTAGAELLCPKRALTDFEWVWRQAFGVPAFLQCRPRGYIGLPTVESQATYLDRLGLLAADERAGLAADAFEDEAVNPFIVSAEEIDRLLGAGHSQPITTPRGERALSPGSRWPTFQPRSRQ